MDKSLFLRPSLQVEAVTRTPARTRNALGAAGTGSDSIAGGSGRGGESGNGPIESGHRLEGGGAGGRRGVRAGDRGGTGGGAGGGTGEGTLGEMKIKVLARGGDAAVARCFAGFNGVVAE